MRPERIVSELKLAANAASTRSRNVHAAENPTNLIVPVTETFVMNG